MRVIDKIKLTNKNFIGRERRMRLVAKFSSIVLGLLIFATLSPIYIKFSGVEAVSGTANPSTTTLSLNVVDNLLSLDLSPTSSYGTFASSSPTSIQVSTNNVSGYTLSIKSSIADTSDSNAVSNATNLVNTVDSTKVISSISTATSSFAFSFNTNTQYNNKWGYLPSKLNSLNNTNYLPSPSYNEATILSTTTCANGITSASCTTSSTDTYTITLGARVDSTLPTGSYEHDFVLIAVGNPINYSITYHANDGADGANTANMPTPNPQTGNADTNTTSVVLSTNKPRRQGKAFKGWCTVEPTTDPNTETDSCNNSTDGTGITYQPGVDYGIDQTVTNIENLYAMWGPVLTVNFNGNGLYFNNNTTDVINTIDYDAIYGTVDYTEKYSHTTNLDDAGNKIDNANYPNNASTNEVITIPGASTLHIKLTWGGESANYDWVSFWAGNYPSYTASSNYSTGVKCAGNTTGKYGGGNYTATDNTIECDITGDVVTFAFRSNSSGVGDGYGYYAIITGYDASGNIVTMQKEAYSKAIVLGEYKTPATAAGPTNFLGWSEDATATTPTYADESDIISNLPYVNGEGLITLYAIWNPIYTITYVNNCSTFNTGCSSSTSANISTQEVILTNKPSTGTEATTLGASNKFTQTGYKIKSWNTTANGSGTDYAAGTTYTVPAGSGLGDGITLYAHWVPIYTVQYDGNGADNASTGMGVANATTGIKGVRHYDVAEGDTFDLFASNFKRTGYGFVGWSTDSDAWNKLTDNDNTNDAKIWGPNEAITAPAHNGTPITTLYAIWAPAEKDGSNNPVYLQDWEGCSSMTATTYNTTTGKLTVAKNTITALTDKRDNMVYAVARLADGNCWMVENLRLDNGATVGNNINDSSVTNQSLAQGYGGVFNGLADPESADFFDSTTPNSLYTTDTNSTTLNIITGGGNLYSRFPRYNNTNTTWNNNSSSATTPTGPSQSIIGGNIYYDNYVYSYGNYYTWAAAIADTGEYNSLSTHPKSSTSICPSGWHLPNGGSGTNSTGNMGGLSGGFSYLDKSMDGTGSTQNTNVASNKWRMFPNNFIYSGFWLDLSAYDRGFGSRYWSSSVNDGDYALSLILFGSDILPGTSSELKLNGFTVRCVAGGSGS